VSVDARNKIRPTTIADVARLANVVPSTVSHALNGTAPISKEVRERILRIARELNYQPSAAARSLLSGRTMTMGMLVADIVDPQFPDIVSGVESALAGARYGLLLCSVAGNVERLSTFLDSLASRRVDAVIVVTDGLSAEMLEGVTGSRMPTVLVNSITGATDAGVHVTPDLMTGMRAACSHLRELGHERIALMTDELSDGSALEAITVAAWEQSGGTRQDVLTVPGNTRLDGGRMALEAVLAARPRPTALIAASDMAAIGVIQSAEEQGLRIPRFLSVIGTGDIIPASLVNPPLTTIALPRRAIGVAAAEHALALAGSASAQEPRGQVWLPTSLVIRRSTGVPPRA
jgi:LacI family transcriptional regulator